MMKLIDLNTIPSSITIVVANALSVSPAFAVECYETVTTTAFLTENLHCELTSENPYAIIVSGPSGNLQIQGDGGITCTGNSDMEDQFGLLIEGTGRQVRGGIIENCPGGILVSGSGSHSILNMEIKNYYLDDGIKINSDNNIIKGNTITGNPLYSGDDGIDSNGNYNLITHNTIKYAGDEGILIDGEDSTVLHNYISYSGDDGIDLDGTRGVVSFNTSEHNSGDGILIDTNNASVSQNTANYNGAEGIEIADDSSNNIVRGNTANSNQTVGILIEETSSESNIIRGNTALGNMNYDLSSPGADPTCLNLANEWGNNTAESSEPACLRFLP
ncbi:right-handed parallel beta-helix repeat-containing protein [Microbulbifer variabilis]|uniref:right-handed parallel beta-helix repeat-containing protein n=1 Tax=Microbulbifer variabilis TaxID=266805 RepID=UPI000A0551BF|nr:right-handed parallel beta-helix repeat-containing protein [Microbulbifer variabilis]